MAGSPRSLVVPGSVQDLDVEPRVSELVGKLRDSPKTLIDLPTIANAETNDRNDPYTAKFLVRLYLVCFNRKLWNLCDLIVDTWIRKLHTVRALARRDPRYQVWRPNPVLEERQRLARDVRLQKIQGVSAEFDTSAPQYKLGAVDPDIDDDVVNYDSSNLNELYQYTPLNCGARRLWADSMALGGDKVEDMLVCAAKRGVVWHPDLLFNIMTTSLRMMRRKLTLKIEETTEGAYCKRYHEHTKHKQPCYRELAWKRKQAGEVSSDEESSDDNMAAIVQAELTKGGKRGLDDSEVETRAVKKVRYAEDLDAEGETDDGH